MLRSARDWVHADLTLCSERKFDPMSLGSQVDADCLGIPLDPICAGTQADPFIYGTQSWLRACSEMLRVTQR